MFLRGVEQGLLPKVLVSEVFFKGIDDILDLDELLNEFLMVWSALEGVSWENEVSHAIKDSEVPE
jgi:hypothetical protein